ncbi:hypothetical protein [Amycolatopsis mediterranei]|uniref:hypothetical protein n=1 Tax=Amycolatopsis mediterranei TaxID=33910 RepID=UPI003F4DEB7C
MGWRDEAIVGYQRAGLLDLPQHRRDFHALQPGQCPEAIRGEFEQFVEVPAVRDGVQVVRPGAGLNTNRVRLLD